MTVQELIDILKQYDPEAQVLGTWEGITRNIVVYQAQGRVLLDVDNCDYKEKWQSSQKVI